MYTMYVYNLYGLGVQDSNKTCYGICNGQVARKKYADWISGDEVNNARFCENSTKICMQMSSEWFDIGKGWKLKPVSNPEVHT